MDKGAARSRKRQQLQEQAAQAQSAQQRFNKSSSEAGPSSRPPRPARPAKPIPQKKKRPAPEEQSRDPELYKAKAVRSNAALDWNAGPFILPPASLDGITRVDLTGSGVTDVSWLRGSSVRWLGLSGCKIEDWSPVGSLTDLTVLNINDCGLEDLPEELKGLRNLKALVAMNNPWTTISQEVLASWPELNSLIISHSPNLTAIPRLATLYHLSKLTFSHCPRITPASVPSMADLPLLRDVKMNNLPLMKTLPKSLPYWGTGPMSKLSPTDDRKGQGLEVLDVGNCSLSDGTLDVLKKADFPILRSLTLHHNPLETSRPKYAEELQGLRTMPKLAIIDNKRVVERVKKEGGEKKGKKARERTGKPSGANTGGKGQMREWGKKDGAEDVDEAEGERERKVGAMSKKGDKVKENDGKDKKRKRSEPDADTQVAETKRSKKDDRHPSKAPADGRNKEFKRPKTDKTTAHKDSKPAQHAEPAPAPAVIVAKVADPSALVASTTKKHTKNETGVFGVVDVRATGTEKPDKSKAKGAKGKGDKGKAAVKEVDQVSTVQVAKPSGGIDLKSLVGGREDNGLGAGGW